MPSSPLPSSAPLRRQSKSGAKAIPLVLAALVAMTLALLPMAAWAGTIAVDGVTCTLPEAVGAANVDASENGCTLVNGSSGGADTLNLAEGTHSLDGTGAVDVAGLTAAPRITSTITVVGQGVGATVRRTGNSEYRLFYVSFPGRLTVENVTITNFGGTTFQGGAIYNFSPLTLTNSSLVSNTATSGGGFYSLSYSAVLLNSNIVSNTVTSNGGGYFNHSSVVTMTNSNILSNTALLGGGIYNFTMGTNNLTNSTIAYNSANTGAGIYNSSNKTNSLANSSILSNTAINRGGGIYDFGDGPTILTNSFVIGNAASTGGGILNDGSAMTLTATSLIGNKAADGGALYQDNASATTQITESCIIRNSDTAVRNNNGATIDATDNWWGASNGPAGEGPGIGDSVSASVDFSNFKSSPILGCPFRGADMGFVKSLAPLGNLLPGQPLTYTLTITSNENRFGTDILIKEMLPADFEATGVISTGVPITRNGSIFQIGQINSGEVATIVIFGNARKAIHSDTTLTNTAVLSNALVGQITRTVSSTVVVPRLNWSSASYTATEGAGSVEVTVTLSPPNPYSPASVQVVYTDSLPSLNIAAQLPITVEAGVASQAVTIPFADDSEIAARTIDLSLHNPLRATLGALRNATITLIENDEAPVPLGDIFLPKVEK